MARLSASDLAGLHSGLHRRELAWALLPAAAAALLACFPVFSGDIWMHLASARLILESGGIPTEDPFLYTAVGNRWVNHSWAAQLLFYVAHAIADVDGLVLARMLLTAAGSAIFWLLAVRRGAHPWIAGLCATILTGIAAPYYITRPLMLAPLCTAGLLLCLRRPTWPRLGAALVLQLAWANLHASFALGIVLFGLHAVLATARHALRRRSVPGDAKSPDATANEAPVESAPLRLWIGTLAALGVSLLNPNGVDLLLYVVRLHQLAWVREVIEEWRPPEFWRPHNYRFAVAAVAVWILTLAALARRRRLCPVDVLVLALFTWQAFVSRRFILLWAYLAIPTAALAVTRLLPHRQRLHRLAGVLLACLGGFVLTEVVSARIRVDRFGFGLDRDVLPVRAVEFLQVNRIVGNVACAQYAGGYILWTAPAIRPATDGRCLVNDPETIKAFNALGLGRPAWRDAFPAPGDSDVMLIENGYHHTPLHTIRDTWRVVYWDDHWVVWIRRGGAYDAIIAARDTTLSSPNVLQHVYKDLDPDEREDVRVQLERRIETDPEPCGVAYALLGYTRYVDAILLLAEASKLEVQHQQSAAGDAEAKRLRAVDKERQALDRLRRSIALFEADLLLNPGEQRSLFAVARSLVWMGESARARTLFEMAAQQDPTNWVHAVRSVEYATESLAALLGDHAREAREARALAGWLRDRARAERDAIRTRYRLRRQEHQMPRWLWRGGDPR